MLRVAGDGGGMMKDERLRKCAVLQEEELSEDLK